MKDEEQSLQAIHQEQRARFLKACYDKLFNTRLPREKPLPIVESQEDFSEALVLFDLVNRINNFEEKLRVFIEEFRTNLFRIYGFDSTENDLEKLHFMDENCRNGYEITEFFSTFHVYRIQEWKKSSTNPFWYFQRYKQVFETIEKIFSHYYKDILAIKHAAYVYIKEQCPTSLIIRNMIEPVVCEETAVLNAAANGDNDRVVLLLKQDPTLLEYCQRNGRTALWMAASQGHTNTVKVILHHKAKKLEEDRDKFEEYINQTDIEGISPLFIAVKNGHDEVVKLLLEGGANINSTYEKSVPYSYGDKIIYITPLYEAVKAGVIEATLLLLERGAVLGSNSMEIYDLLYYGGGVSRFPVSTLRVLMAEEIACGCSAGLVQQLKNFFNPVRILYLDQMAGCWVNLATSARDLNVLCDSLKFNHHRLEELKKFFSKDPNLIALFCYFFFKKIDLHKKAVSDLNIASAILQLPFDEVITKENVKESHPFVFLRFFKTILFLMYFMGIKKGVTAYKRWEQLEKNLLSLSPEDFPENSRSRWGEIYLFVAHHHSTSPALSAVFLNRALLFSLSAEDKEEAEMLLAINFRYFMYFDFLLNVENDEAELDLVTLQRTQPILFQQAVLEILLRFHKFNFFDSVDLEINHIIRLLKNTEKSGFISLVDESISADVVYLIREKIIFRKWFNQLLKDSSYCGYLACIYVVSRLEKLLTAYEKIKKLDLLEKQPLIEIMEKNILKVLGLVENWFGKRWLETYENKAVILNNLYGLFSKNIGVEVNIRQFSLSVDFKNTYKNRIHLSYD